MYHVVPYRESGTWLALRRRLVSPVASAMHQSSVSWPPELAEEWSM